MRQQHAGKIQPIMSAMDADVVEERDPKGRIIKETYRILTDRKYVVTKTRGYGTVNGRTVCTRITVTLNEKDENGKLVSVWVDELDVQGNKRISQSAEDYRRRRGTMEDIPEDNVQARTLARTIKTKKSQVERMQKEICGLENRLDKVLLGESELFEDTEPP